ncbi:unnamed protein product [Mortierella alpina]
MAPSSTRGLQRAATFWCLALCAIILAFTTTPALALDESQAGVIDWHHRWIGTPHLTASPRTIRGSNNVFVATDKNTVASIRAKTGELVWRQVLPENEPVHALRVVAGNLLTLSGSQEFHARLLDAKTGQAVWEFAPAGEGSVPGLDSIGQAVTVTSEDSNLIILNQGAHVRKVNSKAGSEIWHWKAEEGTATTYFSVLEAKGFAGHADVIYVAGLTRGIAAFSIEVVALDSATGAYIKTFTPPKSMIDSFDDVLTLGGGLTDKLGYIAWLEADYLKVLTLGTDRTTQPSLQSIISGIASFEELAAKVDFVSLRLPEGHTKFLLAGTVGEYHDAKGAALLDINEKTGKPEIVFDLGERSGFSSYSAATKPGTEDVVILRAYRDQPETAILELIDTKERDATLVHTIPLDYDKFAHFTFASLELYSKGQGIQTRAYFSTMDGSFHAYSDVESERWQREESLAYIKTVEFVDLPERKLWTQDVNEAGHVKTDKNLTIVERYVERLASHMSQLKDLPAFVLSYANPSSLFSKAPVATEYSEVHITLNNTIQPLYRDQFGVRKILVFGTTKGKLVAVDSANKGQIVWSKYYPWGHDIKNLVLVRHANVRLPPVLAMFAETIDGGQNKVIRMYRINALNGEDYEGTSYHFPASAWIPAGHLGTFKLPIEDPEEKTQVLCVIDERMHITPFPSTEAVMEAFKGFSEDFYFMLHNHIGAKLLQGFKPIISADLDRMDVEPVWTIPFPKGEEVVAFAERPSYEVMASLGRVLGDRGVLYKYQNPNYATVLTLNRKPANGEAPYLTVYLVDIVKGSILYQATHENVGLDQPILATQYENNVVYTFWSEGETSTSAKGFQAVALELFESKNRNQRSKSDTFSSFAGERPDVIAQSFPFPHVATAIGVTSTKAGISSKDILFGLSRQSIMAINKRLLDPRRPTSAPTALEKEEMLYPYAPLPEDPRMFLSYHRDVAGIKKIATSPTLLESTTVVVAYGQDVFVTKHAPSKTFDILNEDFSKSQLMLTMAVLVVILVVTAPMMEKKMLRELWY